MSFLLYWRRFRVHLPRTPKLLASKEYVEPIEGETRGAHYNYCSAARRPSRYGWAPDHYIFVAKRNGFVDPLGHIRHPRAH